MKISTQLITGTYTPSDIRRVWIPKPGKTEKRPLGIPTLHDKIVQQAILMVLEAMYEPIFEQQNHNFGFRPHKGCHDAIIKITQKGQGMSLAIEGDIKGAYNNVKHKTMINILSRQTDDNKFLNLIDRFMKAGIFDEMSKSRTHTFTGVPQGGIVSPILFNIYMYEFDKFQ